MAYDSRGNMTSTTAPASLNAQKTFAYDASTDPMIVVIRAIDPDARAARKEFEDKVDSVVRRDGTIVAKARFAQSGFTQPPDATFTLRLSYGTVKGYQENGKAIPFAFVTGFSRLELPPAYSDSGVLGKPASPEELLKTVAGLLAA